MDDTLKKMKTEGLLAHLPPLRRRQFLAGAAAAAGLGALGLPRMASATRRTPNSRRGRFSRSRRRKGSTSSIFISRQKSTRRTPRLGPWWAVPAR